MYYLIKVLGFLTPLLFVITFSTELNQKLPFSDFPNKQTKLRLLLLSSFALIVVMLDVTEEEPTSRTWFVKVPKPQFKQTIQF